MLARPEAPTRAPLRRRPVAVTVALAVVLVAAGCSKKSAPETVVPAGFVAVRSASSGFAVAVPADWIQIPLPTGDLDEFDEKSRALLARYEALGPAINSARQILQSGGKLMAVTPDGSSRINLTIDKADEKSLEEITQKTTRLLQENGATDLQQTPATTGAGPAVKMTFKYPIPARGNDTVIADEVQYYLLRGKKSIVLTVINTPADVAEAVAGSLRLR